MSCVTISVSMEFKSNILETVSVIRVDIMSDITACCLCTQYWLSEPFVLCLQANRKTDQSQAGSCHLVCVAWIFHATGCHAFFLPSVV